MDPGHKALNRDVNKTSSPAVAVETRAGACDPGHPVDWPRLFQRPDTPRERARQRSCVTNRKRPNLKNQLTCIVILGAAALFAQESTSLFFREDWREIPAETPVTQQHVGNPRLLLALYGPGRAGVRKSHHDKPADDPYYVWSGESKGNWALTLRDKASLVDLTGPSKIRLRAWQSGFRQLHIILKLAGGSWLISDGSVGPSAVWRECELDIADMHWRGLNIDNVVEGEWVDRPDLSKVDEIGWTDLMTGGGSSACSRVDWIEVYGKPVKRP